MTTITDYKEGVCQCRSCSSTFHQSEVVRIQTEHNGLKRTCPNCGSNTYGLVDYPVSEEELIYKNGKFFDNNGKIMKKKLDQLVMEEE